MLSHREVSADPIIRDTRFVTILTTVILLMSAGSLAIHLIEPTFDA
jgi:hypothetical protein